MGYDTASFRDRSGRVLLADGAVYRCLSAGALADWNRLKDTAFFRRMTDDGRLVGTREADADKSSRLMPPGDWIGLLEHDVIPFVSYPYEWSFGMLRDAALLQLDILLAALREGLTLKDASAFNIQWRGARPVFIDMLSFAPYRKGAPWAGYRQFCQMFLYPLFLQAYRDVPFHPWTRGAIEGITPEQCRRLLSLRDLLRPGVFTHVYLQAKLQERCGGAGRDARSDLERVGFDEKLIRANLRSLRGLVESLHWRPARSEWSEYGDDHSYAAEDHAAKKAFVEEAAAEKRRTLVWDLGANRGDFSRLAAEHADCVLAMDADHLVVERLYQELKKDGRDNILPLVMNVADASPGLGWRGAERRSLPERGRPGLVLCLALLHHMVITHNIPLAEFVAWLAELGGDLVIEFIDKQDPMVRRLLLNKADQYADYERSCFESCLSRYFTIVRQQALSGERRVLYYGRRK
ncbi:MAG: methyltransferase [Elusimicrobiota bacterium]